MPREWELFALSADPGETRNLIDDRPEVARQLRQALARHLEDRVDRSESDVSLDPELARRLRALGYLADSPED